jgi:hypothetical protein
VLHKEDNYAVFWNDCLVVFYFLIRLFALRFMPPFLIFIAKVVIQLGEEFGLIFSFPLSTFDEDFRK